MADRSGLRLRVLNGVRLTTMAEADTVAETLDTTPAVVLACLRDLAAQGLLVHRAQPPVGWALTQAGRHELTRLLSLELAEAGARPALAAGYDRFRVLNPDVLDACSRWQVRDEDGSLRLNDHRDARYDVAVLADLAALHSRARPVCRALAAALARYRPYGRRLDRALDCIQGGDTRYVADPLVPSYHAVWFQLHEDLLATLELDRASEAARPIEQRTGTGQGGS